MNFYPTWGTSGTGIFTIDIPDMLIFNNVNIANTGDYSASAAAIEIVSGSTINILGDVTFGRIPVGSQSNTLVNGSLSIKGDLSVNQDFRGGNASIDFNGSSNQNLTGTALIFSTGLISINNSAGITLLSDFTINGNLDVILGDVNLNSYNFSGIDDISTYTGSITKNGGSLNYNTCSFGGCPSVGFP